MRLRYRLEMSDNLSEQESRALNRDISQLEALIEELLTYARLDRPQNELNLTEPNLPVWLTTHLDDVQSVNPDRTVRLRHLTSGDYGALDMRLMERVPIIYSTTPCATASLRFTPVCCFRVIKRC